MGIAYEGVVDLEIIQRPAYYLRIDLPSIPGVACNRQDFYIDAETLLPAGTDLWLPNGELDARYRYTNVRTDVQLTDTDFRLSVNHPFTQPAR
jgi:outer membrane lipoprotein-sorting protein